MWFIKFEDVESQVRVENEHAQDYSCPFEDVESQVRVENPWCSHGLGPVHMNPG